MSLNSGLLFNSWMERIWKFPLFNQTWTSDFLNDENLKTVVDSAVGIGAFFKNTDLRANCLTAGSIVSFKLCWLGMLTRYSLHSRARSRIRPSCIRRLKDLRCTNVRALKSRWPCCASMTTQGFGACGSGHYIRAAFHLRLAHELGRVTGLPIAHPWVETAVPRF